MGLTGRSLVTPLELKLMNAALKAQMLNKYGVPRAYVEIVDTDGVTTTTLSTCVQFTISISRDELKSEFSCMILKARDWNPRGADHTDLLTPNIRKRINIYYGEIISGSVHYVKVFTGVMVSKPESYSFSGSDYIVLRGRGLDYLLEKAAGTYLTATFSGTSKKLLEYWLDLQSIEHSLSYTDPINVVDLNISYANALAGFQAIRQAVGPNTDVFLDNEGVVIFKDLVDFDSNNVEFAYTQTTMLQMSRGVDTSKVITMCDITGDSATAVYLAEASDAMVNQYGRNRRAISSAMVTSAGQAQTLAEAYIEDGARYEVPFQVGVVLNPYLSVGSLLTLEDSSLSDLTETEVRITGINHTFVFGSTRETRFGAYAE